MKKMLSYVLWGEENKYWYNIPYLLVANSEMFSDFHMRFYVHQDSGHPFFVFLEETSKKFEKVELEVLDTPYKGTQLTVQRMKPLWEEDVEYLFCRDVDYAVSSLERKCMDYFMEQNKCFIHSIRGWRLHHSLPMYGGLCGFDATVVFEEIKDVTPTFNEYENFEHKDKKLTGHVTTPNSYRRQWKWETDQFLLRDFFSHVGRLNTILDCPQLDAPLKVVSSDLFHPQEIDYEPTLCVSSEYDKRKIECDCNVKNLLDGLLLSPSLWKPFTPFVGRSWTCVSDYFRRLLYFTDNEMSRLVEKIFIDKFGEVEYRVF